MPTQRMVTVKQLLAQRRGLLMWDNFETVREMPDPAGATLPLDEAGRAAIKGSWRGCVTTPRARC